MFLVFCNFLINNIYESKYQDTNFISKYDSIQANSTREYNLSMFSQIHLNFLPYIIDPFTVNCLLFILILKWGGSLFGILYEFFIIRLHKDKLSLMKVIEELSSLAPAQFQHPSNPMIFVKLFF